MKRILSFIFAIAFAITASAQTAKAIWTAGNTTLTFVYNTTNYTAGTSKYNGQTVTNVWTGAQITATTTTEAPAWNAVVSGTLTKVVFDASFKNVKPTSCYYWFANCKKLTTITGLPNLTTTNVTSMAAMFMHCDVLTSLDVSKFNTANVTTMHDLFSYCSALTSLNVTGFNTAKVTSMAGMFEYCSSLTSLNVLNFNTAKVTNMSGMFTNCSKLTTLDVSKFNTANVTNMGYVDKLNTGETSPENGSENRWTYGGLFQGCSGLTTLNISNFNTAKVTNMKQMFQNCSALTTLTINTTNFNTAKVTDMSYMFSGCSKLTAVDVSKFSTAQATDTQYMFNNCNALTSLTFGNSFTAAKVTNMQYMFYNCSKLTALNLSNFNTAAVTDMRFMFYGCSSLTSLTVTSFNTAQVTNMRDMFNGCSKLASLNVSSFNTSNVTVMWNMFRACSSLTSLDLKNFNTSKVTDMDAMFYGCSTIMNIDLSALNTSSIKNSSNVFYQIPAQCFVYMPTGALAAIKNQRSKNLVLKDGTNWTCANCEMTVDQEYDIWYQFKATALTVANSTASAHCLYNNGTVYYAPISAYSNLTIPKGKDKISATFTGQAVWTAGNTTLTFVGTNKWKVNDTFTNGQKITAVWTGTAVTASPAGNPAWISNTTYNVKASVTKVVFDASFKYVKPNSCRNWFYQCSKLTTVTTPGNLNASEVTTMLNMFRECTALTTLDISAITNTPKLTTTRAMFYGDTKLTTIKLGLNTAATTNIGYMFFNCSKMTSLTLGGNFSTAAVTGMDYTFSGCAAATTFNLSNFNTSKVTTMEGMFNGCTKLATLTLGANFKTASVTTMASMFNGCAALRSLDLSSFTTLNVTTMANMFKGCSTLTTLGLSTFNTPKVTTMDNMFNGCSKLTSIDAINFHADKLTSYATMFTGLPDLCFVYIPTGMPDGLKSQKAKNLVLRSSYTSSTYSCANCWMKINTEYNILHGFTATSLTADGSTALVHSLYCNDALYSTVSNTNAYIPLGRDKLMVPTAQAVWTEGNHRLSFTYREDLSVGGTYNGYTITNIWKGNDVLATGNTNPKWLSVVQSSILDVNFDSSFQYARPTSCYGWFMNCPNLTNIYNINNLNTSSVTTMAQMFRGCTNLQTLVIPNFNTANVTNMGYMFAACPKLSRLILNNFNTAKVTSMESMFAGCTGLEVLDAANFNTGKVTAYANMFKDVPEMCFIYTPDAVRAEIRNMRSKNLVLKDGSNKWTCANCWMTIEKTYGILYDFTARSLTADGSSATVVWLYKDNEVLRKITAFANEAIPQGNDKLSEGGAPQVLWTEGNTTLTFLVPEDLYAVGDTYNGETITKVWIAFNTGDMSTPTWLSTVQSTLSNVVFDNSFATYLPESCSNWFYNCTNLTTVTGWENLKTSEVISFYQMFKNDAKLQSVDVSGFETSNCRRFQDMFQWCSSLTSIDVTNFNTAKATSIGGMFAYCSGLTELDLSSFETPLVTDFGWIVRQCTNLQSLDISNFNTTKLTVNGYAFEGVSDKCFIFIPNSQWNKLGVTTKNYNLVLKQTNGTFTCAKCWVEHDTEHKIYHDFTATNLTVNGSDATTHYVYCDDVLHSKVEGLTNIAVPEGVDRFWKFGPHAIWTADNNTLTFTASTPLTIGGTFNGRTISKVWEGLSVTTGSPWQAENLGSAATEVVFDELFNRICPTSCDNWFASFDKLTGFTNWSNLNTSQVTSMNNMFADCSSLTSLDLSTFDTQKVTSMNGMFKGCTGFSYFDLLPLNTENVTSSTGMFEGVDNSVFVYMNSPVASCIATDRSENLVQKLDEDDFTCANCVLYDAKTLTLPYGFTALDGVTYMRNIPANTGNAYTVFLPYEREVPEGTKVYTLRTDEQYLREEKKIVFEEVVSGIMEAYKPYLLSNLGSDITDFNTIFDTEVLSSTTMPDKPTIDDLQFTGTIRTIDNAEAAAMGAYIMQVGNKWKKVTTDKTTAYIPAYRAYIVSPTGNIKTWLSELELPDETGIESIETIDRDGTRTIYDLSGRRLNKTQRGINIVNGRKVVIK